VTEVELRGPILSAQAGHQLSIYCTKELCPVFLTNLEGKVGRVGKVGKVGKEGRLREKQLLILCQILQQSHKNGEKTRNLEKV
jgi:hypothetical protein